MFNILEQPWLLVGIGVVVFFAQRIFRSINPDKCSNKYLLVPLFIVALAFGIDYLVKSDIEKVNDLVGAIRKAVIKGDAGAVKKKMTPDYFDGYHHNRDRAIRHLDYLFSFAPIQAAKILEKEVEIDDRFASVKIKIFLIFDESAPLGAASVVFSAELEKQNKNWLIATSEIHELNKQQIKWADLP